MIRMSNALLLCAMILVFGAVLASLQGCAELKEAFPELTLQDEEVMEAERPKPEAMPSRQVATMVKPTDIRASNCQLMAKSYGFPLTMREGDTVETQRLMAGLNNAYMCTCLKVLDRPDGLICGT